MQMLPIKLDPDDCAPFDPEDTTRIRRELELCLMQRRPTMIRRAVFPMTHVAIASTLLSDPTLLRVLMGVNMMALWVLYLCVDRRRRALELDVSSKAWLRAWVTCEFVASGSWSLMLIPVTLGHHWGTATLMVCTTVLVHTLVTALGCSNSKPVRRAAIAGPLLVMLPLLMYHARAMGFYPILTFIEIAGGMLFVGKIMLDQTRDVISAQIKVENMARNLQASLTMSDYVARHDGLTGLLNRTAFEDAVQTLRDEMPDTPIAIVMIDLDHFKMINDRHGHPVGDAVLRVVGDLADRSRRSGDPSPGKRIAARWGGEEFILAIYDCAFSQAIVQTEAMRCRLALHVDPGWPEGLRITASLGVSPWRSEEPLEEAIAAADLALYRAKNDGRNRIAIAGNMHLPGAHLISRPPTAERLMPLGQHQQAQALTSE